MATSSGKSSVSLVKAALGPLPDSPSLSRPSLLLTLLRLAGFSFSASHLLDPDSRASSELSPFSLHFHPSVTPLTSKFLSLAPTAPLNSRQRRPTPGPLGGHVRLGYQHPLFPNNVLLPPAPLSPPPPSSQASPTITSNPISILPALLRTPRIWPLVSSSDPSGPSHHCVSPQLLQQLLKVSSLFYFPA